MILRSWDGHTKNDAADEYADYLRETGFRDLVATEGNRGAFVLRRREGAKTRFRVLSLWESMRAIRRFAGRKPERARYYPKDRRYLESLAPEVDHFDVLAGTAPERTESQALGAELRSLADGEAWHGPALEEILKGVSAAQAYARPLPGAHSIWELVLHVTAWSDVYRRRLQGKAVEEPEQGDFPLPAKPSAVAWHKAKRALFDANRRLAAAAEALSEAGLRRPIARRPFDAGYQVGAAIRHLVYHSGQMALLRKAFEG
jgi:uncharacterized damage-inducible protein DinB